MSAHRSRYHLARVEEVQVDLDHVLDRDEVALLHAVAVPGPAFEELHATVGAELVEVVERDRRHAALVRLARAVDIEVPEPHDLRRTI